MRPDSMTDYRMPESLRCPKTGRTWNTRVPDEKRLEVIPCESCGGTHSLTELLDVRQIKLAPVPAL